AARLREESIVVVGAVDEVARLVSPNAAESEVSIGGGGQAARILGHAWRKQRKVGEAATVQGQVIDRSFVNHGGDRTRKALHQRRSARNRDGLARSRQAQAKRELGRAAHIYMDLRSLLRGHALDLGAGGVVAGW